MPWARTSSQCRRVSHHGSGVPLDRRPMVLLLDERDAHQGGVFVRLCAGVCGCVGGGAEWLPGEPGRGPSFPSSRVMQRGPFNAFHTSHP